MGKLMVFDGGIRNQSIPTERRETIPENRVRSARMLPGISSSVRRYVCVSVGGQVPQSERNGKPISPYKWFDGEDEPIGNGCLIYFGLGHPQTSKKGRGTLCQGGGGGDVLC